jgi:hypothetical protein
MWNVECGMWNVEKELACLFRLSRMFEHLFCVLHSQFYILNFIKQAGTVSSH